MPDFIQTAVKEIDDQLRALKDETSRLEAARAALAGPTAPPRTPVEQRDRADPRAFGKPTERSLCRPTVPRR